MARVKNLDNSVKAKILKCDCPVNANIEDNNVEINGTILNDVVPATEERKGIIRIATEEEAIAGISKNTAITPHTLRKVTHFVFEQGIASDTWVINHNLNKNPEVTIVDSSGGKRVPDDITYNSENQITVKFLAPFGGKAYLN